MSATRRGVAFSAIACLPTCVGRSRVCADAQGDLVLPGGDTLRNVLRVHTHKAVCPPPASRRAGHVAPFGPRSRRRWNGCCPPTPLVWSPTCGNGTPRAYVTRCSRAYAIAGVGRGGPADASLVSYYYPPADQYYDLPADPQNQLREAVEADARQAPDRMAARRGEDGLRYECRVDDDNVLRVSLQLAGCRPGAHDALRHAGTFCRLSI